jgi:crotonobetainyl-CoA:carnitine CoA-transferase CaiB-like acyl-CoA transferase
MPAFSSFVVRGTNRMLNHCKVLDLTDEKGFLCGKILADLGADVIKLERPGGKNSGRIGPFWRDIPDPEKSLYWFAYNTNKRGITLDIEKADGKEIFKQLVQTADFVIESFPPGYMNRIGLAYDVLKKINQRIVVASITPFGQKGPYRDFKASDMIVMGLSGMLYLTGDADRAPLNISIPQSHLLAGADAAVGAMIAYYHRERTGMGQQVDASMQQSAAWFLANTIPYWEMSGTNLMRAGVLRSMNARDTLQRQVWPCKDGYVFFFILGGLSGAKTSRQLVKWMEDEGVGDEYLSHMDWDTFDMGAATQDVLDRISKPIGAFFRRYNKREIVDAAVKRGISICSLSSMEDLLQDRNLIQRDFWIALDHPDLDAKIPYPRQFAKISGKPATTRFRAPRIGEHNHEVYGEIGLTAEDLVVLKQAGVI